MHVLAGEAGDPNFVGLIQSLGATYLTDLNIGGNAHYTSERFMQEAITSLGEVISISIFDKVRSSPLMCDETTDIAIIIKEGDNICTLS